MTFDVCTTDDDIIILVVLTLELVLVIKYSKTRAKKLKRGKKVGGMRSRLLTKVTRRS